MKLMMIRMWRTLCCAPSCVNVFSPFLQKNLQEEELCKVALTCHFALDVLFPCTEIINGRTEDVPDVGDGWRY